MSLSPAAPVPRGETESAIPAMCNRIRGLKECLAERGKPLATRMARSGINLASSGGKRRPPLLNARSDSLRRGSFKTMLANKRCVIPAEGFYEWREKHGKKQPCFFARKDGKPVMFADFTINLKRSTLIFSYPQERRPITPSLRGEADLA
jgi:putative SOS response-associated peptidase YedK